MKMKTFLVAALSVLSGSFAHAGVSAITIDLNADNRSQIERSLQQLVFDRLVLREGESLESQIKNDGGIVVSSRIPSVRENSSCLLHLGNVNSSEQQERSISENYYLLSCSIAGEKGAMALDQLQSLVQHSKTPYMAYSSIDSNGKRQSISFQNVQTLAKITLSELERLDRLRKLNAYIYLHRRDFHYEIERFIINSESHIKFAETLKEFARKSAKDGSKNEAGGSIPAERPSEGAASESENRIPLEQ